MSLALLYREARHWAWYLASWAMRSPTLSLDRRCLSCSLRAHCLTRMSSSNVDALRKASLAADLPQKKHVSVEWVSRSMLWRVNLWVSGSSSWCVFLFSALWSFVLLYCSLQESCHLALWTRNAASMPWPSSSCDSFSVLGRQLILSNATRCSAMVLYPAPSVPRAELYGHVSISSVSSWHRTHLFQSVVGHCLPDELGSSGSTTLYSLAIVPMHYATLEQYLLVIIWEQYVLVIPPPLYHKLKSPGKYVGCHHSHSPGQLKAYRYTCRLGVVTRWKQVHKSCTNNIDYISLWRHYDVLCEYAAKYMNTHKHNYEVSTQLMGWFWNSGKCA